MTLRSVTAIVPFFVAVACLGPWAVGCEACPVSVPYSVDPADLPPSAKLFHAFLWTGPPDVAPACPPGAPNMLFEAYAGMGAVAHTCPACACGPSETICAAPQTWSAVAASCAGAGSAEKTPFDAPTEWTGVCNTATKIPADGVCTGGVPCVQSVIVDPPQAVGTACTPVQSGEETKPGPPWPWATFARGCAQDLDDLDECGSPSIKSKGAYDYCVRLEQADDLCPIDYTERHELFQDATDERTCAPCTCGPPNGGDCAMKVGAFSDEACELPAGSAYVESSEPAICFDVPDGAALRSKSSEQVFSSPGTCAPGGGAPTGQVVPATPVTWCCYVPE